MERPSPDELISAYFDGETTPEESAVVERLLADPKRRQTLDDYRQLREELRSMPAPGLSAAWNAKLRERLASASPAWAEASAAEPPSSATPSIAAPFSADGKVEPAPPASPAERLPRGDGYSRFRQAWLAAGVGVAAGTLGIVIGWSAQTLRPSGADLDVAVGDASRSPAPQAVDSRTFATAENESKEALAEADIAAAGAAAPAEYGADAFGTESFERNAAPRSGAWIGRRNVDRSEGGDLSGMSSATPEAASGLALPSVSGTDASGPLDDAAAMEKAEEKQTERFAADPIVADTELRYSGARGMALSEGLERERRLGESREFFATYVGVWEPAEAERLSEVERSDRQETRSAALEDAPADAPLGRERPDRWDERSSLSLEGSPEQVAEALEILSRADAGGRVRLLARLDDNYAAPDDRLRRFDQSAQTSTEPGEVEKFRLELETAEALRDQADEREGISPYARQDRFQGLATNGENTAIDRIEAFFHLDRKDESFAAGQPMGAAGAPMAVAGVDSGGFGYGSPRGPSAGGSGAAGSAGAGSGAAPADELNAELGSARPASPLPKIAPAADALAAQEPSNSPRPDALAESAYAPALAGGIESSRGVEPSQRAGSRSRAMQNDSPPPPSPSLAAAAGALAAEAAEEAASPATEPADRPMRRIEAAAGEAAVEALAATPRPATTDRPRVPSNDAPSMPLAPGGDPRAEADGDASEVPPRESAPLAEPDSSEPWTLQEESELSRERSLPAPQRVRVILLPPSALARRGVAAGGPASGPAPPAEPAGAAPAEAAPANRTNAPQP